MWLWVVLGVICTFVIAAVSIGVVSGSLAARPRRSVYDLEEAVVFVADRLPDDEPIAYVLGRVEDDHIDLSDADVLDILDVELEYYRAIGAIGPQLAEPLDPE